MTYFNPYNLQHRGVIASPLGQKYQPRRIVEMQFIRCRSSSTTAKFYGTIQVQTSSVSLRSWGRWKQLNGRKLELEWGQAILKVKPETSFPHPILTSKNMSILYMGCEKVIPIFLSLPTPTDFAPCMPQLPKSSGKNRGNTYSQCRLLQSF